MARSRKYATAADRQSAYRARQRNKRIEPTGSPRISAIPSTARWTKLLAQATTPLETLKDEMQSYFDERSENWQESERGIAFAERIELVEAALDASQEIELR